MREAIRGKTVAETEKRWHAVEKKRRAADLEALLATPWPGLLEDVKKRAAALAKRRVDARITAAFVTLLDRMEFVGPKSRELWDVVIGYLARSGDSAALALLERLREQGTSFTYRYIMESMLDTAIASLREAGVAPVDKPAAVAPPPEIAARQVLADALLEHGDPRGELINLQTSPPNKASLARQRALLKQHEKTWLGQLAGLVMKDSTVWEAGYPATIVLADKRGIVKRATGAPELATVRNLVFRRGGDRDDLAAFFTHPVAQAIRTVRGLRGFELEVLFAQASGKLPPIEALHGTFFGDCYDRFHVELPALRVIGDDGNYGPDKQLFTAEIWHRIERLVLCPIYGDLVSTFEGMAKTPSRSLRALEVSFTGGTLTLDVASRVAEVVIADGEKFPRLKIPKGAIEKVRARVAPTPEMVAELHRMFDRNIVELVG
jgi:hypothetical protein